MLGGCGDVSAAMRGRYTDGSVGSVPRGGRAKGREVGGQPAAFDLVELLGATQASEVEGAKRPIPQARSGSRSRRQR